MFLEVMYEVQKAAKWHSVNGNVVSIPGPAQSAAQIRKHGSDGTHLKGRNKVESGQGRRTRATLLFSKVKCKPDKIFLAHESLKFLSNHVYKVAQRNCLSFHSCVQKYISRGILKVQGVTETCINKETRIFFPRPKGGSENFLQQSPALAAHWNPVEEHLKTLNTKSPSPSSPDL